MFRVDTSILTSFLLLLVNVQNIEFRNIYNILHLIVNDREIMTFHIGVQLCVQWQAKIRLKKLFTGCASDRRPFTVHVIFYELSLD